MNYVEVFVLLQFLDSLSTLIGLRLGATEGNPFVAWLMRSTDPLMGLLAAKFLAIAWVVLCLVRRKPFAVKLANYFFAGVIFWNLHLVVNLLRSPA